jgi:DNA processing protein
VRTEKWRFPVRNRLLAAMSDVVVVIESRHGGGSRHTVNAALDQSKPVGAVPGSIRSATSEGTNAMLADGAFPVCSAADVLLALSLEAASVSVPRSITSPERPRDLGEDQAVYDALSQDPISLEQLLRETGLDIAELCARLERLVQLGAASDLGGWWQRT